MAKKKNQNETTDLLALAKQTANEVLSKSKSGGGRKTYLDRFVENLLDEDGNPTVRMQRNDLAAKIALDMCQERRAADIASGKKEDEFDLSGGPESDDFKEFVDQVRKAKNQVASAVANNENSTSLSYNPAYKDVWAVLKHSNGDIQLQTVEEAEANAEKESED